MSSTHRTLVRVVMMVTGATGFELLGAGPDDWPVMTIAVLCAAMSLACVQLLYARQFAPAVAR